MAVKYTNNASTTLNVAGGINASATSITVTNASVFPAISAPDVCYLTMLAGGTVEVIKVTDITGNVLTCVRGQDGTTSSAFSDGTRIDLRITAALLKDLSDEHTGATNGFAIAMAVAL